MFQRQKAVDNKPEAGDRASISHHNPRPPLVLILSAETPNGIFFDCRPDNECNLSHLIHIRSAPCSHTHAHCDPLRFPEVHDDAFVFNGGVDKQRASAGSSSENTDGNVRKRRE
ncbi:unnamed protein product [Pleuronectes platessa]|uniref:Uncharacterized protein n=1 Tax=Pleuronectes platessa TaxID=8262 RepID=A0A9N7TNS0_PLEPL|nr:unnamed protein product [Pleuronectes platessa]